MNYGALRQREAPSGRCYDRTACKAPRRLIPFPFRSLRTSMPLGKYEYITGSQAISLHRSGLESRLNEASCLVHDQDMHDGGARARRVLEE